VAGDVGRPTASLGGHGASENDVAFGSGAVVAGGPAGSLAGTPGRVGRVKAMEGIRVLAGSGFDSLSSADVDLEVGSTNAGCSDSLRVGSTSEADDSDRLNCRLLDVGGEGRDWCAFSGTTGADVNEAAAVGSTGTGGTAMAGFMVNGASGRIGDWLFFGAAWLGLLRGGGGCEINLSSAEPLPDCDFVEAAFVGSIGTKTPSCPCGPRSS